jgi:hypothetical protein
MDNVHKMNAYYCGPRCLVIFRNKLIFYGKEFLAPRPTPKLEDPTMSAVLDCLFNIFPSYAPYLEAVSSIRNLRTRHAVVTRDPFSMRWDSMDWIDLAQDWG